MKKTDKIIEITAEEMHAKVESWNLPPDSEIQQYTSNHVIHAYTTGVADGEAKDKKLILEQIKSMKKKAAEDTAAIVAHLREKGFTPLAAYLRIESKYSVDILVAVSDEDFVKDSFADVYTFAHLLQEKSKTELYSAVITFINKSKEFNLDALKSDGFLFSFKALEQKK